MKDVIKRLVDQGMTLPGVVAYIMPRYKSTSVLEVRMIYNELTTKGD